MKPVMLNVTRKYGIMIHGNVFRKDEYNEKNYCQQR